MIASKISSLLTSTLKATYVKVEDESAFHAGHAGSASGGETHFAVVVVSAMFEGKTLVERHRAVYGALQELLEGPVHALRLKTFTPGEWKQGL